MKTLGVAGLREKAIHIREKAGDRFAVSKQISVVIDEDGNVEPVFEDGTEGDVALKCGEVFQVADDAARIVCGAGERETDRYGGRGERALQSGESFGDVVEAAIKAVRLGRQRDGADDDLGATDRGKLQTGAPGVERH